MPEDALDIRLDDAYRRFARHQRDLDHSMVSPALQGDHTGHIASRPTFPCGISVYVARRIFVRSIIAGPIMG